MKARTREMVPCRTHLAVCLAVTSFVICSNIAMADNLGEGFCFRRRSPIGKKGGKCQELMESVPESAAKISTADECCSQGGAGWAERISGKKCLDPCDRQVDLPAQVSPEKEIAQVHGQWGEWGEWSECSATCGESMTRHRECNSPRPENGGDDCTGDYREVAWCNNRRNCPIDGSWRSWGSWSTCSITCGKAGTQYRYRSCTAPKPEYGGQDCKGNVNVQRECNAPNRCPIDGGWGEWKEWHCPNECRGGGEGVAWRIRYCSNPAPKYGGNNCEGDRMQTGPCANATCAVDGGWGEWSSWSGCSSSCGTNGFKQRRRECDNPPPDFGGYPCHGAKTDPISCDNIPCEYNPENDSQGPRNTAVSGAPCDDEDFSSSEGGSGCGSAVSGDGSTDEDSSSELVIPEYFDT